MRWKLLAIALVAVAVLAGCKRETEPNNSAGQAHSSGNIIGWDEDSYYGSLAGGDTDVFKMTTQGCCSMTYAFVSTKNSSYHVSIDKVGYGNVLSLPVSCGAAETCVQPVSFSAAAGTYNVTFSGNAPLYAFAIDQALTDDGIIIIGRTSDPPANPV